MKTKILSVCLLLFVLYAYFPENCEALWVKANGPVGGSFRSFTAVGSTVFAGTNSGVYRSTDYGLSWQSTSLTLSIYDLASSGSYIYAATYNGLKISTDNGTTWNATSLTSYTSAVVASGSNVFVSAYSLMRSTDYGQTWTQMAGIPSGCLAIDGPVIFVGNYSVYRSLDNGNTWTTLYLINEPIHSIAVKGSRVFATCESSFWHINKGIYGSTDYGNTWPIRALTNKDIWSLEVGDGYMYAGDEEDPTGVYRSANNGSNWTQTSLNNVYINPNSIFCMGSYVFAGTSSLECFVSTDNGQTWPINSGVFNNSSVYSLGTSETNIFAGTSYFIYKTSNNGQSWTSGLGKSANFIISNNSIIFAGTSSYGVYRSLDNGQMWLQTSLSNRSVYSLAVSGNDILAGTGSYGVYRSNDNGITWTQTPLNNRSINALAVSGDNIFAGTSSYGVYRSLDEGNTWTQTTLNNRSIYSLAVSGSNILAGTSSYGVYFSTDNGETWTQTSLKDRTINEFAISGNYVLAGTSAYGTYLSTDNGLTWAQSGINSYSINSILIKDNYIYAGTSSNGVWKRLKSELIPFDAPVLVSPENNSIIHTFTPVFSWGSIPWAPSYSLKISTDSTFASTVLDLTSLSDTSYTINSGILQDSTSYFWKVSAEGGFWSDTWKFTINIPVTPLYTIEKIQILKADILELRDSNIISPDNYEMLVSKLNNAIKQIKQVHYNISINSIEQFIFGVNLLYKKFILTPEQAQPLLVQAYRIISMLNVLINSEIDPKANKPEITQEIKYGLDQNYPNPFNPVTTIKFNIEKESEVNLSVYDASGRLIMRLVNARLNAGSHEYMFNGANLASGTYFYKLVTDNFTAVKKMILVK